MAWRWSKQWLWRMAILKPKLRLGDRVGLTEMVYGISYFETMDIFDDSSILNCELMVPLLFVEIKEA